LLDSPFKHSIGTFGKLKGAGMGVHMYIGGILQAFSQNSKTQPYPNVESGVKA